MTRADRRMLNRYGNDPLRGTAARSLASVAQAFLQDRLPEYMVPSLYVVLDALPLNANRKIDRAGLPAPESTRLAESACVLPRNPQECVLHELWSEALAVPELGIHDDFFQAGGDSILAVLIVARAAERGLWLRPGDVFRHPTI